MFDLELEKALKERCDADHQYGTLWAQWTFDKKLVAGALNNVVLTFPHYSRHDASHSNTILQQIARVLGPARIARLGATDLWLLLEAAYQHDLGMVVPEHIEREWWKGKEFGSFLDGLQNHSDPELAAAAALLLKRTSERMEGRDWPFEVRRALVLVLADFARRKHADQSKRIVESPGLIGMDVPRSLIPRRFWSLLGRICQSHGANFNKIFELPKEESGLGMDTAHPRFIASMLRLGDLLDLDDGRFCPVATVAFGGLPPSSQAHKAKHHSILEFLVTPERIRVVAECGDKDAFDATEQWLTWLRTELQAQSLRWSELGPAADFGSVPSAERIEVGLQGHMTFKDGRRPHFEVDKEAMLDMVKGAGLYNNSLACIDELLQNAVDATLLRIFEADREKWLKIDRNQDNEALEKLRKELEDYPIDISITKSKPGEGGEVEWTVHIVDQGAGIHRDDIEYIQRIGSSKNNKRRRDRIREMPTWMRPSGIFGIGLQSVFLFSDKVTLVSRADDALEALEIDMWVSEGAKEPDIVVRVLEGEGARRKPGTRVSFVLKSKKIYDGPIYQISEGETRQVLSSYDPLVDDEWPVLPAQIRDTVGRFADGALASFTLEEKKLNDSAGSKEQWSRFFDHKSGIQLSILAHYDDPKSRSFSYRGKKISYNTESISYAFLSMITDWHRDDASKILTLNRQEIRREAQNEILLHVEEALKRIIPKYYEELKNDSTRDKERQALTLAVQVNKELRDAKLIPEDDRAWRMLGYQGTEVTLGEIVDAQVVRLTEFSSTDRNLMPVRKLGDEITLQWDNFKPWFWNLLYDRHIQLADRQRLKAPEHGGQWRTEWVLCREKPLDCIANNRLFKGIITEVVDRYYYLHSRCTIPCMKRFQAMALSEEGLALRWLGNDLCRRLKPRAIFPFRLEIGDWHAHPAKLTLSAIPKLIEYTYKHRLDPNTSELDIARAFLDLIVTLDAWFKDAWDKRIDYSVDELRRVLRKRYGDEVLQIPEPLPDPGPLED